MSRVRVWNADNYTRIIIELGGKAKYQAARISDPDRIYFDIENAKLSSELMHDPIEVPAGGYLKQCAWRKTARTWCAWCWMWPR